MSTLALIDWNSVFRPSVSLLEIFIRGSIVYLAIFALFRFLKREAGSVGIADLLLVVLIADASQNAMAADYKSVTEGIVLVGTLAFWNYFIDWLAFRSPRFRQWITPPPLLLVKDGKMIRRHMVQEMITKEELISHIREQGTANIAEVKRAWMESDGKISVIKINGV